MTHQQGRHEIRLLLITTAFLLLPLALLVAHPTRAQAPTVRVGVYQDAPLVFTDEAGRAQGLYVDLLTAVAAEEGWRLDYVECLFPDCLAMLEQGQIDLMTAIAYSEERDRRFDFTHETVWANWGQVYTRKNGPQSILDLEGRTVTVVQGDIYYTNFRALIESFGLSCTFVELDDYGPVLEWVADEKADAGLVSRLYGLSHAGVYDVLPSPIVCCPSDLRIAAPEGKNAHLLAAIDRHLASWKREPESVYYQALDRWFAAALAEPTLLERTPPWVRWLVLTVGALAVLGFGGTLLFRVQVRARTKELEAEIARRRQSEEAIRRYVERLQILGEIERAILEARSPEEIARAALQHLRVLVPYKGGMVATLDIEREEIEIVTVEPEDGALVQPGDRVPWSWFSRMEESIQALDRGEVLLIKDLASRSSSVALLLKKRGYRALLTAPLRHRGELIGILSLGTAEPEVFDEEQIAIAQEVADVLAIAIQQARLRRELERHATELETLVEERTYQLAESEARYRQLVESPLVGIWQADAEGCVQFINQRLAEISGYSPEEIVGKKNMLDMIAPELRPWLMERMNRRRWGQLSAQPLEAEMVRKDGSHFTALVAPAALFDRQGNFAGFIGAMIDISERKELERRLEEQNREYRLLVNLMAGREIRMAELKEVIRRLRTQLLEAGLVPVADDPLRAGEE